ncbi:hypothetical protein [Nostoc sp. CHAB 5715]|nr:hypothetical protein [Nostoc sp. CHAB 5715]
MGHGAWGMGHGSVIRSSYSASPAPPTPHSPVSKIRPTVLG